MNNEEPKFLLSAYRPDGRDAGDPMFAEALAQAERDPELRTWLERQRTFDAAVTAKLAELAPPAGLRDAILAGVQASTPRPAWWRRPVWLAAAAGLAVAAAVTLRVTSSRALPPPAELTAFALHDLAHAHDDHDGHPPQLASVQAQLAAVHVPLTRQSLNLTELRSKNCRAVRVAGREVFEICFQRGGVWYHVYVARRADFAPGKVDPHALFAVQGAFAGTAWADTTRIYALVTDAGADALRRVL